MKLKALKKQHLMISDAMQTLNVIFNLHLLATIVLCFKQIIFYVFPIVQGGIFFNLDTIYNTYIMSFLILLYKNKIDNVGLGSNENWCYYSRCA